MAKRRVPVAAIERLVDGSDDLHVLLRHRPRSISLLPQPGGFEALSMASEIAATDDLAAAIREQLCEFAGEVQLGCSSRGLYFSQREHGFPEVTNVVKPSGADAAALQGLPGLPGSGMAAISLYEREPFDLRVEQVDPRAEVVAVPSVHGPPEALHVLLRHRLLP